MENSIKPGAWMRWLRAAGFFIWTIGIIAATTMNDPTQTQGGGWIEALLTTFSIPHVVVAKSYHFAAYAFWTWLLMGLFAGGYLRPAERRWLAWCICLLVAMSCFQESLQFLNPTRHPSLWDVGLNVLGGLACLIARPWLLHRAFSLTPRSRLLQP